MNQFITKAVPTKLRVPGTCFNVNYLPYFPPFLRRQKEICNSWKDAIHVSPPHLIPCTLVTTTALTPAPLTTTKGQRRKRNGSPCAWPAGGSHRQEEMKSDRLSAQITQSYLFSTYLWDVVWQRTVLLSESFFFSNYFLSVQRVQEIPICTSAPIPQQEQSKSSHEEEATHCHQHRRFTRGAHIKKLICHSLLKSRQLITATGAASTGQGR